MIASRPIGVRGLEGRLQLLPTLDPVALQTGLAAAPSLARHLRAQLFHQRGDGLRRIGGDREIGRKFIDRGHALDRVDGDPDDAPHLLGLE